MIFTWQKVQWQQLWQAQQAQRLPHALLFAGITGTGKTQFAQLFCQAILCQQTISVAGQQQACAVCHACQLVQNKTHPNLLWIEPEKPGHAIKIDQIREVSEFVSYSSLQGEYRFVIVSPANQMNTHAANALLKTLEEPSSGAILILISHDGNPLPATIVSRCQQVLFPRPDQALALTWLQQTAPHVDNHALLLNIAQGAPLIALQYTQKETFALRKTLYKALHLLTQQQADPIQTAAQLLEQDIFTVIDLMQSWMMDIVRLQMNVVSHALINQDYAAELQVVSQQTQVKNNFQWLDALRQARKQLGEGFNLNKQLFFEGMLIRLVVYYSPSPAA
jgi:DNA polymerase-3 subunit delta'